MTYPVILSRTAQMQLRKLQSYLARRFYPANAEKYIARVLKECASLGMSPHRCRALEEVRPGVRVIGFEGTAAIYFRFSEDKVTILGVRYRGHEGP